MRRISPARLSSDRTPVSRRMLFVVLAGLAAPMAPVAMTGLGAAAWAQPPMGGTFQVNDVAIVSSADTALKSGDAVSFYPVATLKAGQALKVLGESGGYIKVAYPAGTRAFVLDSEGKPDASGKTVKLTKSSALHAANLVAGPGSSWKSLMDKELPAGTELTLIEQLTGQDGKPAYAVVAPAGAYGFVDRQSVRKATAEETANFNNGGMTAPKTPTGATPPPAAQTPPPAAPVSPPTSNPPMSKAPPMGTFTPPPPPPSPVGPATVTTPSGPATGTGEPAAPAVVTPPAPASPTAALEALFKKVQAEPREQAEYEQAISAFQQYKSQLGPRDQMLGKRLDRCIAILQSQMQIRDDLRANDAATKKLSTQEASLNKQYAELEKQHVYTMIGRLVASPMYDGEQLPLLYRIQSPEPGSGRTLGYLKPDPKINLAGKVGQVVGIIGETQRDDTLKTVLVLPTRIEVVSLAPVQPVPTPADGAASDAKPADKPADKPAEAPKPAEGEATK